MQLIAPGSSANSVVCVCFQAQIAFLQGERKGQENLKKDLVRRIKMLEYALKQERSEPSTHSQPQYLCLCVH